MKYLFCFFIFIISSVLTAQPKISQIKLPDGYKRITFPADSYSAYIQSLPLKKNRTIALWNGVKLKPSSVPYNVFAVIDKPILFKEDLEQCADYAMRFWADYHNANKKLKKLYLLTYVGEKKYYKNSNMSYLKFLRWHMVYSNSFSIKNGTKKISMKKELVPGDMFVQFKKGTGGIGHVSVIVDAAENKKGERIYLIGYSYMPAQEFHIEDAKDRNDTGAWFTKSGYVEFLMNNGFKIYGKPVIRRF